MNKLQYDIAGGGAGATAGNGTTVEGPWNQRPRDVANLARWMGKQLERDLNWQSVTIKAPVEELSDAPILYVAGNKALAFSDEDQGKLKQFVENGGLILGNADCASADFAKSFTKFGASLFGYEFRELPASHPIYTAQGWPRDKWRNKPAVLGLSNGVRELMLLLPSADASRFWQISSYGGREENFQLPADIFLYAVDKRNLRYKGETYSVKLDPAVKADRAIRLARLEYPSNWDPEPGGWRRMAAVLHNRYKADVRVETVKLGDGKLGGYKVAHLTGAAPWKMTDAARAEIRKFVEAGGTLIVDAAGGGEFGDAVEADLASLFPGAAEKLKTPLPPAHPAFSAATGKPPRVGYRNWAKRVTSANLTVPRVRAIEVNGRAAVFFSKEDLSAGLVGYSIDGINGYDPETATELMADMLLYADGAGARP